MTKQRAIDLADRMRVALDFDRRQRQIAGNGHMTKVETKHVGQGRWVVLCWVGNRIGPSGQGDVKAWIDAERRKLKAQKRERKPRT